MNKKRIKSLSGFKNVHEYFTSTKSLMATKSPKVNAGTIESNILNMDSAPKTTDTAVNQTVAVIDEKSNDGPDELTNCIDDDVPLPMTMPMINLQKM